MIRVFLISDTHFYHKYLEELGVRPNNFCEKIIINWNRFINNCDLIVHLGDLSFGHSHETAEILKKLNGRKILVLGNHDKMTTHWYLNNGFDFVCHSFSWKYFGKKILFTHEPADLMDYNINIHGHSHEGRHRTEYVLAKNHFLFSLEYENYMPVLLKTFLEKRLTKKITNSKKRTISNGYN